jgi:hypothetical protein
MKKKAVPSKKKSAVKKVSGKKAAARKKAPAKKASARKAPKKRASAKKAARALPRKKKTNSRAHTRPTAPSSRPQPVPPGNEQPAQLVGEEDEHGPMHIPSHKPAPAYADMHQNDWAGKPPQHNIPIPKH